MKNLKEVCIKNTNNSQSNSTDIVAFLASSNVMLEVFCAHSTFLVYFRHDIQGGKPCEDYREEQKTAYVDHKRMSPVEE
jgi:hypothetical protein